MIRLDNFFRKKLDRKNYSFGLAEFLHHVMKEIHFYSFLFEDNPRSVVSDAHSFGKGYIIW